MRLRAALCFVFLTSLQPSCGGTVCGNGKSEGDEECDDGNADEFDSCSSSCTIQETLDVTIAWKLISTEYQDLSFTPKFGETCGGVEADKIEITISGPTPELERLPCNDSQHPFRGLMPGNYTVSAKLLREDSETMTFESLTGANTTGAFSLSNLDTRVDLDFAYPEFHQTYRGNFFYRFKWDGADTCAKAGVATQTFRLERDGQPLDGKTRDGEAVKLDGSVVGECHDFSESSPSAVNQLAWGPARAIVVGFDSFHAVKYRGEIDTFVGAGVSNPEAIFDVPASE